MLDKAEKPDKIYLISQKGGVQHRNRHEFDNGRENQTNKTGNRCYTTKACDRHFHDWV